MIILNGSINLSKLDKSRFIKGKNGAVYVNLTAFVSDEPNEYGQDVAFIESQTKEEREEKASRNYVGNGKVSYNSEKPVEQSAPKKESEEESEDLPF